MPTGCRRAVLSWTRGGYFPNHTELFFKTKQEYFGKLKQVQVEFQIKWEKLKITTQWPTSVFVREAEALAAFRDASRLKIVECGGWQG